MIRPNETIELRVQIFSEEDHLTGHLCLQQVPEDMLPRGMVAHDLSVIDDRSRHTPSIKLFISNHSQFSKTINNSHTLAQLKLHSVEGEVLDDDDDTVTFHSIVGPACESEAWVNGIPCKSLLDSGSQVTTLSRSFYNKYLKSSTPLHQIDETFHVEGAGGQRVPYDGVVSVKVRLPREIPGTEREVETWPFIYPDTGLSPRVPLIVGTNTFSLLANKCGLKKSRFLFSLPVRSEIAFAYQDSSINETGKVGNIKILEKRPVKIPSGCWKELSGVMKAELPATRDTLLLQQGSDSGLPEGVVIYSEESTSKGESCPLQWQRP